MATLLARKAGTENPIATDDDHHEALASDPTVSSFPQGSSFGDSSAFTTTTNSFSTTTTTAAGGFGSSSSTGNFGGGATGFGSTGSTSTTAGGFGSAASGQGSFQGANMGQQQNLTEGAKAAVEAGAESTVALDKDAQDWINKKWRPVMGWVYMMTCTCDFVLFPVLWSILQALTHGNVTSQWQPLTLQGAGLYHVAMGAVLGIAAYGRTKEKIEGAAK